MHSSQCAFGPGNGPGLTRLVAGFFHPGLDTHTRWMHAERAGVLSLSLLCTNPRSAVSREAFI